jgi:F-type H+-transporting ATPase subunit alpha
VPIPVEKQVVLLYAGANGYIDTYPESSLKKYEQEVIKFMEDKYADVFSDIKTKKEIDASIDNRLRKALDEFKGIFTY